jgi:antirestriction protein ArdC
MEQNNSSSTTKVDVYQIVTDRIVSLLEAGTVPWQKPWTDAGVPMNAKSKRKYRGINFWLLLSLPYERHLYLTWDQIKEYGASVKKGEVGHVVLYWKTPRKKEDENENQKQVPILRYYKVFNVSQITDLPADFVPPLEGKEFDPILECDDIIRSMPGAPEIRHKHKEAFYHIGEDYINMPKQKSFKSIELYYSTLFHELVHSTGHEKRLNRKSITEMAEFGSELYSIEELIAEMGSAYLSSFTGIQHKNIEHNASYIKGWLGKLINDKRFIVQASGQAQKAVDFIMNQQVDETKEDAVPVVPLEEVEV